MKSTAKTCYMCNCPAISKEHVPPKCIFPEIKDSNGSDFRNQLITVPSCEIHNSKKSQDDEFLMVSIAGLLGNNSVGFNHFTRKVSRAIKKSSGKLLKDAIQNPQRFEFDLENNEFAKAILGTPNHDRLRRCFDQISRGIYYHEFGQAFSGRLVVIMPFLIYLDANSENFGQFVQHKANLELRDISKSGSNFQVFYYHFTGRDEHGVFLLKICFYQNVEVFISFIQDDVELPRLLPVELIGMGIKTLIELEGKTYHFNCENGLNHKK